MVARKGQTVRHLPVGVGQGGNMSSASYLCSGDAWTFTTSASSRHQPLLIKDMYAISSLG